MFRNFSLLGALISLPGILLGFTFHEYAHAYMAVKFGDPTPKMDGRLTVNPLAHVDIWGLLLILVTGFGWAKPVHTNPSYYRGDIRQKELIVSFSGPVANLIIAFAAAFIYVMLSKFGIFYKMGSSSLEIILAIFGTTIWINCVLFVFNLVPIPPLDGFHILLDIFPQIPYRLVYAMERYGYIVLLIFVISGASNTIIGGGASIIFNFIQRLMLLL